MIRFRRDIRFKKFLAGEIRSTHGCQFGHTSVLRSFKGGIIAGEEVADKGENVSLGNWVAASLGNGRGFRREILGLCCAQNDVWMEGHLHPLDPSSFDKLRMISG